MERWRNKVAVVTGASAGIGAACVRALLGAGMVVVGLARRQERVEQMRAELADKDKSRLLALKCDVTRDEQVRETFDSIRKQLGSVDVLVSNAGIIAPGELSGLSDSAAMLTTMETNVMGSVYCIREAFNTMRDQGTEGHVVIINSVAGQQVPNLGAQLPSLNIYPATKFALRAMNETYRQEFQRHKTPVRVSTISPGLVDTDILPDQIKGVVKENMAMLRCEDVADAVLFAISMPPDVQVSTWIL
ncbi:hypothetical protein KR009_008122 [Drosophila setifemur]|nr:hypothetical protein KR009_008122 [Drosophila setifemur]